MLIHVATDNDIHPPRFVATQRTWGLCRALARRHDVRALCVVPNRTRAPLEEEIQGVVLRRRRAWYTSVAWRLERWGVAPLAVAAAGHRRRAARLLEALPEEAPAFAADLLLTPLFDSHPAPLKIYTAHNVEADHFRATQGNLGRSDRWRGEIEALERHAARAAGLIVACTDEDAARFRELYGIDPARITIAPNGWDETRLRPAEPESRASARDERGFGEHELVSLFVGSDVPHNVEAAHWLVDDLFPRLEAGAHRLVIAGTVARTLTAPRRPWLTLAGEVEPLEPWLHAADVGLNPVTSGGGSNVKLPAYLAAGLAVVTTPFGLRGYPGLAPLVTAAPRSGFASALDARPRGWAAREEPMPPAVADLAWGRIGERLAARIERAASAPASRRAPAAVSGGGV